jgi:hypothetical protein
LNGCREDRLEFDCADACGVASNVDVCDPCRNGTLTFDGTQCKQCIDAIGLFDFGNLEQLDVRDERLKRLTIGVNNVASPFTSRTCHGATIALERLASHDVLSGRATLVDRLAPDAASVWRDVLLADSSAFRIADSDTAARLRALFAASGDLLWDEHLPPKFNVSSFSDQVCSHCRLS